MPPAWTWKGIYFDWDPIILGGFPSLIRCKERSLYITIQRNVVCCQQTSSHITVRYSVGMFETFGSENPGIHSILGKTLNRRWIMISADYLNTDRHKWCQKIPPCPGVNQCTKLLPGITQDRVHINSPWHTVMTRQFPILWIIKIKIIAKYYPPFLPLSIRKRPACTILKKYYTHFLDSA